MKPTHPMLDHTLLDGTREENDNPSPSWGFYRDHGIASPGDMQNMPRKPKPSTQWTASARLSGGTSMRPAPTLIHKPAQQPAIAFMGASSEEVTRPWTYHRDHSASTPGHIPSGQSTKPPAALWQAKAVVAVAARSIANPTLKTATQPPPVDPNLRRRDPVIGQTRRWTGYWS